MMIQTCTLVGFDNVDVMTKGGKYWVYVYNHAVEKRRHLPFMLIYQDTGEHGEWLGHG